MPLTHVHTWNRIDDVVAAEIGAMLGVELVAAPTGAVPPLQNHATVAVTVATPEIEALIGVGVGDDSVAAFLELLFGEPEDADVALDAVCELANLAGGATQRASLESGVTFALGLPTPGQADPDTRAARAWLLQHDTIRIYVWTRSSSAVATPVMASELQAGMVLATKVVVDGHLILGEGSVITEYSVERLLQSIGADGVVDVVKAA